MSRNRHNPTPADRPVGEPSADAPAHVGLSRRTMLAGLGISSLLAAPNMLGFGSSAAATAVAGPGPARTGPRPGPTTPEPVRAAKGKLVQPGPFYVQASCDLSEDYFLTDDVLLADADNVLPFRTAQGEVEALVLASGKLSHLRRDASAASGWCYTTIHLPDSAVTVLDAAVATGGSGDTRPQVMVLGALPGQPPGAAHPIWWMALEPDGNWVTLVVGAPVSAALTHLRAGVSSAGPYWYGWTLVTSGSGVVGAEIFLWNKPGAAAMNPWFYDVAPSEQYSIVNAVVLWDPNQVSGGPPTGFVVVQSSVVGNSLISVYPQQTPKTYARAPKGLSVGESSLLWAYHTPGTATGYPGILWQDPQGNIAFQDETGTPAIFGALGSPGASQVTAWQLNGLYTFTYLHNGLASVVSQIGTGTALAFTDSIPLVGGFEKLYSLPTDPTQATLFAVDVDQTLNVLTKNPTTGWTQNVVHQDGATNQPLTSWRVQICAFDANGRGVANGGVQLSTDRPVGLWQASGHTILLPGAPLTVPMDAAGRLTVSIPAEELDVAVLTAQALDAAGIPSGNPLLITPNVDVHNFLAGTTPLTGKGTLTGAGPQAGQALLNAQRTTWDPASKSYTSNGPLFAALTGAGAAAVAGALNHVATLGLTPTAAGAVQSAVFDLTGKTPTFTTSPNPAPASLLGGLGASNWWNSVKHDAESVFHGLRHGAIRFKHMVSSWDRDAEQWLVNLTVDIGDGLDNLINYVVTDIKTAIHAISGFFQALGADLKAAWEWLKNLVLGLIAAADEGAKVMQGWLSSLDGELSTALKLAKTTTDNYFSGLTTTINGWISTAETTVEKATFGRAAPLPAPTTNTGSNDAGADFSVVDDVMKVLNHSPAMWLYHKISSYLPSSSSSAPDFTVDLTQIITDLLTDISAAEQTALDAINLFWASIKPILTSKDSFNQAQMTTIFADLEQVVDDVLKVIDDIADTVLDTLLAAVSEITTVLTYEFPAVPLIGELLEMAGIDDTISVQRIITLIAAYPTALIDRIANGGAAMFPPQTPPSSARGHRALDAGANDPWGLALNVPSAVIQTVWTINDAYIDVKTYQDANNPDDPIWRDNFEASPLMTTIDIVAPILLNVLQWPSKSLPNGKTAWPFYGGIDTSSKDWGLLVGAIVSAFVPPLTGITGAILTYRKSPAKEFFGTAGPIIYTIAGFANTVLGATWTSINRAWLGLAESIIGNISYDLSFLGLKPFADNPDVLLGKTIADTIGNAGAAVCYIAGAIEAGLN